MRIMHHLQKHDSKGLFQVLKSLANLQAKAHIALGFCW